jgi:hypothetical protein
MRILDIILSLRGEANNVSVHKMCKCNCMRQEGHKLRCPPSQPDVPAKPQSHARMRADWQQIAPRAQLHEVPMEREDRAAELQSFEGPRGADAYVGAVGVITEVTNVSLGWNHPSFGSMV